MRISLRPYRQHGFSGLDFGAETMYLHTMLIADMGPLYDLRPMRSPSIVWMVESERFMQEEWRNIDGIRTNLLLMGKK